MMNRVYILILFLVCINRLGAKEILHSNAARIDEIMRTTVGAEREKVFLSGDGVLLEYSLFEQKLNIRVIFLGAEEFPGEYMEGDQNISIENFDKGVKYIVHDSDRKQLGVGYVLCGVCIGFYAPKAALDGIGGIDQKVLDMFGGDSKVPFSVHPIFLLKEGESVGELSRFFPLGNIVGKKMILNETKLRIYARKIMYEVKTLSLVFNDEGYLESSYIDIESRLVPPPEGSLGDILQRFERKSDLRLDPLYIDMLSRSEGDLFNFLVRCCWQNGNRRDLAFVRQKVLKRFLEYGIHPAGLERVLNDDDPQIKKLLFQKMVLMNQFERSGKGLFDVLDWNSVLVRMLTVAPEKVVDYVMQNDEVLCVNMRVFLARIGAFFEKQDFVRIADRVLAGEEGYLYDYLSEELNTIRKSLNLEREEEWALAKQLDCKNYIKLLENYVEVSID